MCTYVQSVSRLFLKCGAQISIADQRTIRVHCWSCQSIASIESVLLRFGGEFFVDADVVAVDGSVLVRRIEDVEGVEGVQGVQGVV